MDAPNPNTSPAPCLEMAHVLFMDIVAYSTMHMDQQQSVLGELQEEVRNTSEFGRAQAEDQLIRLPTGDGMALVFFRDPEAPVRCALELSRKLRDHPEIKLRMGIHSGPVYRVADINANRNVAGGGIIVAQRVMDCGDAGHILISSAAAEVLGQVSAWSGTVHDLGEIEVKHGLRLHIYNLYLEGVGNPELPRRVATKEATAHAGKRKKHLVIMAAGIVALGFVAAAGWLFYAHTATVLTARDTIVLADFANSTGDPVFEGTLRQGLAVQLGQSPFLNIVSDQQIAQMLRYMGQPPDARLTKILAREVCQRMGSAAVIEGSIANIDREYVVGLNATNCHTGENLAQGQKTSEDKAHVLAALGKTAKDIRGKLGESHASLKKFDAPIEQATTPSLEALQAYNLGLQAQLFKGEVAAAVPFFQRAVSLDPNFAMAYAILGNVYYNLREPNLAAENLRKAFDLRDRVSEREKFYISSHYYDLVLGDLVRAAQAYELWAQTYPRELAPLANLGVIFGELGEYDKALSSFREAIQSHPESGLIYGNLAAVYVNLNRSDEARAIIEQAQARKIDNPYFHIFLYEIAFLQDDVAGMVRESAWAAGKPGVEDLFLFLESYTAAYVGQLGKARDLTRRAMASAFRADEKETAARYEASSALCNSLFGRPAEADHAAMSALKISTGRDVQAGAALALGLAGDLAQAAKLADNLSQRFSQDTVVQFNYLPTIRAAMAVSRRDTSGAIEDLQAASPYELGNPSGTPALMPVYVRGQAYLAAHQGSAAGAEFQKILDHRGIVGNAPIGALAHLGLARSYALQGDDTKARAAYQDFLTLWKDADLDIPIFITAKAEDAKLK
jgi:tetratricopeptide (TPR) repeat protein/class 3 adenylate cyclase